MLYLSKTIFVYQFNKILVTEPTTEVKAESIGAPSVKEIAVFFEFHSCKFHTKRGQFIMVIEHNTIQVHSKQKNDVTGGF
jgi:hypothetical protein